MKVQGAWDVIESKVAVDMRGDQMALAAIYQGISAYTIFLLAEKETVKEAWETLKTIHMGAEHVMEA